MRLAAIDLGTNTVRLLVVETQENGSWWTLADRQRITRLGKGLVRFRPPGTAIVLATMKLAGAPALTVSDYGLREGA